MLILETPRLIVRRWQEDDYPAFHALFSDPEVMRYVDNGQTSDENVQTYYDEAHPLYTAYGFGWWAVILKEENKIIGAAGLGLLYNSTDIEILYMFHKMYWGKGFAFEVAAPVLQYGFERYGLKEIYATIDPQNHASIRVAQKLGMTYIRDDVDQYDLPIVVYVKHAP